MTIQMNYAMYYKAKGFSYSQYQSVILDHSDSSDLVSEEEYNSIILGN